LKHPEVVGSTGENIVIAGDSAGGNLATSTIIKCIEMGIPPPKGLFAAYTTFLVNLVKAPSRFMGFMDTFLNYGIIMKVFKSYGNGKSLQLPPSYPKNQQKSKKSQSNEIPKATESDFVFEIPKNYLLSPYWAPDDILKEFPPTTIVSMITDPCLDESVDFAKKLKSLGVNTQMRILEGLVHGFLNFTQVGKAINSPIQYFQYLFAGF
jgi:acetyl esterase/lipase